MDEAQIRVLARITRFPFSLGGCETKECVWEMKLR